MKTLEKKAVITTTSLGSGTAGILPPKKMPGVVKLPRPEAGEGSQEMNTATAVTMVALRQLVGDWGNCPPNGLFEVSEEIALKLEADGKAYRYRAPLKSKLPHPNKMFAPAENK